MGRLTISLPDELETQLDSYAQAHGKPVSQVVADAVRALLSGSPAAPPVPVDTPAAPPVAISIPAAPHPAKQDGPEEDVLVRRWLDDLFGDLCLMLTTVNDLSILPGDEPLHKPPYNLRPPPWQSRGPQAATQPPGEEPETGEDGLVRGWLEDLFEDLKRMLQTVNDLSVAPSAEPPHAPPDELQPPPWPSRSRPGS